MININNLSKSFSTLDVLKDINLQVNSGEVVVILGPSGSGKSTLLRCINGLEELTSGTIEVSNIVVDAKSSQKVRNKQIKKVRLHTGMVFQQFNLYPHKTVLENVMEALLIVKKWPKNDAVRKGETLLNRVGLIDKRDVYPSRLSGGQQQRVAIARALAMEPDILLFDEPTSALDPELVDEVLAVIKELALDGMTMAIVTHEMTFAQEVADRIVFMSDGAIVEDSPPDEFFSRPQSERARKFLKKM
ncbi:MULTISPECIES: amino acid ABC transporter ATP-binding protein [Peribacillus]|uniref:Polar amino acid ABC transporter ATP-binding protein n=1 Tax=Peribacillus simplex TaxID=1478 RepID=A0A109N2C7_9BACI|nr:amino acid ABC transporter ATP-binding protein [Peribacillus simplex]KWW22133.1 polar amino acid ABC transporter ATP-binding protein [Peribacillus simplex]